VLTATLVLLRGTPLGGAFVLRHGVAVGEETSGLGWNW
jgi:hypothetical protein